MLSTMNRPKWLDRVTPVQQAYGLAAVAIFLQYLMSSLAYAQVFPDVLGKSLNKFIRNSTYMIPGILAVSAVFYFEGRAGLKRIFKPYLKVAINPGWFLLAMTMMFPILWLALVLQQLLEGGPVTWVVLTWPTRQELIDYTPLFIRVAVSDELFWIGFIYPRLLMGGYSRVKAGLTVGLLWGLDYLPFILTGFFVAPGLSGSSMVLGWFALAPLYIWLYHKTGSATLLVLFNVCMQYAYNILPVLPSAAGDNSEVAMGNFVTFCVGMLLWRWFPKGDPSALASVPRMLSGQDGGRDLPSRPRC